MDTRFIEYCISEGYFSLSEAKTAQANMSENISFYRALVHMNVITQEQLAIAAGEFYELQVVDLSQVTPEPAALHYGSPVLCRKLEFLPFAVDPSAGLLVAVSDYTKVSSINDYLQGQRIDLISYYIAPCDTLNRYLDRYLELKLTSDTGSLGSGSLRRNNSIMHTQYPGFETGKSPAQPADNTMFNTENTQRFAALQKRCDSLSDENVNLRQQIDKLNRMLDLEAQLSRQLISTLKSSGVITGIQFDQLLNTNR